VLQEIGRESKASASSIAVNSTRLDSGSLIYQASFNSSEWSGRIQAYTLGNSGELGGVYWDTDSAGKIPAHGQRNIVTGVGDQGVIVNSSAATFSWDNLSSSQKAFLNQDQLSWVRGDQSLEGTSFRSRVKILGDVVNSDPFYVGSSEDYGYQLLGSTEGNSYTAFLATKASRTPMLYVGANDGMLHGFNAQTGVETFAYIPIAAYPNLASLSQPNYTHRYFVDGGPRANDAYIDTGAGASWKTVLLGSMGAGGRSVFALDVTNPANLGVSSVMWEFATAPNAAVDQPRLGVAMSQPVVARLKAGDKWVAIFGNGYDSGGTVRLFIVDLATGTLLKSIDTGESGVGNGLGSPVPVDTDGDRITDYVYAGDLKGNLWKFDLTANSQSGWDVSIKMGNGANAIPKPIFAAGVTRPITSRPTVGKHPDGGYIVYFGTGKYFETNDAQLPADPTIQEFYGIRDNSNAPVNRDDLQLQSILYEGVLNTQNGSISAVPVRVVSNESANSAPVYGWRLPLISPLSATANGERVVSSPVLRNGRIIFATIIPDESVCGYGGRSWLMELDAITGGNVTDPVLDVNADGRVDYLDLLNVNDLEFPASGIGTDEMIKTPGIIGAGELEYKYTSGTSGTIGVITETGGGSDVSGRQSWRQLQ
jgi:type IV pilus assembly protein PilY1